MSDGIVEHTPGGAVLLDGNRLRDETVVRLRGEIEAAGSPAVCLATVLVGSDKPSQIYVRMKHRKAEEAGMVSRGVELPETATQAEVEEQVAVIFAGVNGYLDGVDVSDVGRFESGLLEHLRSAAGDVLDTIRDEQKLSDETEAKLRAAIEAFGKSFA